MFVTKLRCVICCASYRPVPGRYVCDRCGDAGTLDVRYDYEAVGEVLTRETLAADRDRSMWRYRPLLPIDPRSPVSKLGVGGTPLIESDRLARRLGMGRLWIKDEGRQPTSSLKDRASAVALARAKEDRYPVVTTASTSNVGVALAGLAAETGQSVVIFVPVSVPGAKLAQMQVYGATVIEVDGSYHDAFELSMHAVERLAWYNCNTGINPYVGEGKKTVALEIVEQLGWEAPDAVFVSVGDGSIIGGVHKGFRDAVALGWIDRMPRLYGVQAAGSAYLADAWANGEDVVKKPRIRAETEAHSISADLPLDRVKAMAAVSDSGGAWVTVEDHDILDMIPEVATRAGVFSEPAAAAAFAGLDKVTDSGWDVSPGVAETDRVVVISTGSGLKDIEGAMYAIDRTSSPLLCVGPDPGALELVERYRTWDLDHYEGYTL